ncbi:hypothetical protein C0Q70_13750 [Pomacea canaliculata]|uniref:DNA polymerase alpha subunit B n=1 Tax=Pomacea canaliculata TaxID=400727 RepID=A0A2T7NY38_POMCA|nr:hypothetical protein C0Q70_13750 [Pomacea canaliculata]
MGERKARVREMCLQFHQTEAEIAQEWVAFKSSKPGIQMSFTTLEKFEKEWLPRKKPRPVKQEAKSSTGVGAFSNRIGDEEVDLLTMYTGTPTSDGSKSAGKRQITPEEKNLIRKRLAVSEKNPAMIFSPNSFSPAPKRTVTPSSNKFLSRTSAGEVLVNFGATNGVAWGGAVQECTLAPYRPSQDSTKQYRYMFQKLSEKAQVLDDQIEEMTSFLCEKYHIEEFVNFTLPAQDVVHISGRVACDSIGKLNSQSVVLEGSRQLSQGRQIAVDLSELTEYALFPGQVIAAEGVNITGKKLLLKKVFQGVPLPLPQTITKSEPGINVRVLIAAGPYSAVDDLEYQPLVELLDIIERDTPDVCILMGPFVDSKNTLIENSNTQKTYKDLFNECMDTIADRTSRLNCKVILVPSLRDVHHHPVYPQGPYSLSKTIPQNFYLATDPCTMVINNIVFGLTSTDVLFHIGAEEVALIKTGNTDRLERLVRHMLQQHSYYPLYPPAEDVNADYEHFESVTMPVTPHVLITPSDLRYFIKESHECCCINPGRLAKGQVGGTYARLVLQPPTSTGNTSVVSTIAGQILRI